LSNNGSSNCKTCFIELLEEVIRDRIREGDESKSYTARIASKGIYYASRKLGEEALELVIEAIKGDRNAAVREAADLVYHLLVLLALTGLSIRDVVEELERRAQWRRE